MLKVLEKNKQNKVNFQCPLCDSTEYQPVYQNDGLIGSGRRVWITHYICAGCGVHFSDPKKFSKKSQ
ncbi:MAG: hypothetical protein V1661_02775 [bacterium]